MPSVVVNGATIACSMGLTPSVLTVLPDGVAITSPATAAARVTDFAVGANISTFGMCTSPANPAVQAATAAASGTPTPAPCVPIISAPWTPPSTVARINAVPVLLSTAQCVCAWAGVVTVASPGELIAAAI
jgi:Domain of unknown function (DUF4280)